MNIDTSLELHVYRAGNGIKLLSPNHIKDKPDSIRLRDTKHTVSSMLELPLSVYFI